MKYYHLAWLTLAGWAAFWTERAVTFGRGDWWLVAKILAIIVSSAVLGALSVRRDKR